MFKGLTNDVSSLYSLMIKPAETRLSKLPLPFKLTLLTASVVIAALSSIPEFLAVLACLTAALSAASGDYLAIGKCVKGVKYLLVIIAAATAASTIAGGGGVAEALINSGVTCLRTALILTCFSLIATSVGLNEALSLARRLRVPNQLTYSVILSIRFIPLVLYDLRNVTDSLMLKGVELGGGLRSRIKALRLILESVVIVLTYRIDRVTESVELRGILD